MATKHGYVDFYRIIGTDTVCACVYERTDEASNTHSTITTIKDVWHGRLGTRVLPAEIDAIPVGPERSRACNDFRRAQYDKSHDLIISAGLRAGILNEANRDSAQDGVFGELEWRSKALADKVQALSHTQSNYISVAFDDLDMRLLLPASRLQSTEVEKFKNCLHDFYERLSEHLKIQEKADEKPSERLNEVKGFIAEIMHRI